MFPKVLLQWCAAISSCAAEIGKLFHGSATFVCLLCQQATCAVRLWHFAATTLKPCVTRSLVRCVAQRMLSFWVVRKRWDAASCYATAIWWCSCVLSKAFPCFCRAHGCSSCFSSHLCLFSAAVRLHTQAQCLPDVEKLAQHEDRQTNTQTIKTRHQQYLSLHEQIHPQSLSLHSCQTCLFAPCSALAEVRLDNEPFFFAARHFWESLSGSVTLRKEAHGMLIPLETAGFSRALSALSHSLWFYTADTGACGFTHTTQISAVHQKTSGSSNMLQTGVGWRMWRLTV